MPGKKSGLKTERKKKTSKPAASKSQPKPEPQQQPLAKVHPFAKFIQRRHQDGGQGPTRQFYQEPPRKKAV